MFDGLAIKVEGETTSPCLMLLSKVEGETICPCLVVWLKRSRVKRVVCCCLFGSGYR